MDKAAPGQMTPVGGREPGHDLPTGDPTPLAAEPFTREVTGRRLVVVIDDEPLVAGVLQAILADEFDTVIFNEPEEALRRLPSLEAACVITDLNMPGLSGFDVIAAIRGRDRDVPIIVITGRTDLEMSVTTLRAGAVGFLPKPFRPHHVTDEVHSVLARARLDAVAHWRTFGAPLLDGLAFALLAAIEARDIETADHCRSIGTTSEQVALALGMREPDLSVVRIAGFLHDVGKVGIPDRILLKPGKLDDSEWAIMQTHPEIGERMLSVHERLRMIASAVRGHHERWDGHGYPDGLVRRHIPAPSRVIAVADTLHAMTTDRPYRAALGWDQAVDEIQRCSGTQFDPDVVEAFMGAGLRSMPQGMFSGVAGLDEILPPTTKA